MPDTAPRDILRAARTDRPAAAGRWCENEPQPVVPVGTHKHILHVLHHRRAAAVLLLLEERHHMAKAMPALFYHGHTARLADIRQLLKNLPLAALPAGLLRRQHNRSSRAAAFRPHCREQGMERKRMVQQVAVRQERVLPAKKG